MITRYPNLAEFALQRQVNDELPFLDIIIKQNNYDLAQRKLWLGIPWLNSIFNIKIISIQNHPTSKLEIIYSIVLCRVLWQNVLVTLGANEIESISYKVIRSPKINQQLGSPK